MEILWKGILRLWNEWRVQQKERILRNIDKKMLDRAKATADHLHRQHGKKYYVILGRRGYEVMNSHQINRMKKLGILKKGTNFMTVQEIASYIAG